MWALCDQIQVSINIIQGEYISTTYKSKCVDVFFMNPKVDRCG